MSGFLAWMNPAHHQRMGALTWMRCSAYSLPAVFVVSGWACSIARAEEVRRETDGHGTVDRSCNPKCIRHNRHDP